MAGPEKRKFYVHGNLLRQKSRYFEAALSDKWSQTDRESPQEDENKKDEINGVKHLNEQTAVSPGVSLDWVDEDPDVVETVIDWLYHGTLPKLDNKTTKLDYNVCLLCYKFSEVRMMYDMKNKVMDVLRQDYARNQYVVSASEIKDAYNLDLRHTQMGRFLIKLAVFRMMNAPHTGTQAWQDGLIEICEDSAIAKDIVKEVMEYKRGSYGAPDSSQGCHFHDHSDGGGCSS